MQGTQDQIIKSRLKHKNTKILLLEKVLSHTVDFKILMEHRTIIQ